MEIDEVIAESETALFSDMNARELAIYFKTGYLGKNPPTQELENRRRLAINFLIAQPDDYQNKFYESLKDPHLGQRYGDDFPYEY